MDAADARQAAQSLALMAVATTAFLDQIDALKTDEWDEPSLLPGWRRREVVAHVHNNALALGRLVAWARTGIENRMYKTRAARDADIERDAELDVAELRARTHASAAQLAAELESLTDDELDREVVAGVGEGRRITAVQIPWMRCREAAIHAVDLGADVTFDRLDSDLVAAIASDLAQARVARGEGAIVAGLLSGRSTDTSILPPWA